MLSDLEGKVTAVVGDALAGRAGLSIVRAAGPPPAPAAGKGIVRVGLSELTPDTGAFRSQDVAFVGSGDSVTSRRVLPVQFVATIEFARTPATADDPGRSAGRGLLLEDMSFASHALGDPGVRDGSAFRMTGADPGFDVRSFELTEGTTEIDPPDGSLTGRLAYTGRAEIWPVEPGQPEGVIGAVDVVTEVLPLAFAVDDPAVPVGGSTTVRIRTSLGARLQDADTGARQAIRLAVAVASDLPPAERGTITSGQPGAETGTRIVPVTDPETEIAYSAPTGDPGSVRLEQVAVHLAAPDGRTGVLLGTVAVPLAPGA